MSKATTLATATLLVVPFAAGSVPPEPARTGEVFAQRLDGRFAVGDRFPDFALPSLADGAPMRLSDFRGQKVMLHVFASW